MNHPMSGRSGRPFALDRLELLVRAADADRLRCLFQELAMSWSSYADVMVTLVQCQNKSHKGGAERRTPALFQFGLRELAWIPAVRGKSPGLYPPGAIWISSGDIPKRVLGLLPTLSGPRAWDAETVGRALGMVDGARASAAQLIDALRLLADESTRAGVEITDEAVLGARWITRHLNDALGDGSVHIGAEHPLLLARMGGKFQFVRRPFFADDPLIADLWRDEVPILEADRELRRLHRAFDLRDLRKSATILPRPEGPKLDKSSDLGRTCGRQRPILPRWRLTRLLPKRTPYEAASAAWRSRHASG